MECVLWVDRWGTVGEPGGRPIMLMHADFVHSGLSPYLANVVAAADLLNIPGSDHSACFHWWRQDPESGSAKDLGIENLDVLADRFMANIFGVCRCVGVDGWTRRGAKFEFFPELSPGWEFRRETETRSASSRPLVDLGATTVSEILAKYAVSYRDRFRAASLPEEQYRIRRGG